MNLFLDNDDIDDIGYAGGALKHCFKIGWGYKQNGIIISERGLKLEAMLHLLNQVIPLVDNIGLVTIWLDVFICVLQKMQELVCLIY